MLKVIKGSLLIALTVLSSNSFAGPTPNDAKDVKGKCNLVSGWYSSYEDNARSIYVNCEEIAGKKYQTFYTPYYTDRGSSFGCKGPIHLIGAAICSDSKCTFGDDVYNYITTFGIVAFEITYDSMKFNYYKSLNPFCDHSPEIRK